MPEKCNVVHCTKPAVSKGLCDTHRKQVARHGDLGTLRPADWGKRNAHPAYPNWKNFRRAHADECPREWIDDFWKFVADVPEKPEGKAIGFRLRPNEPWGKDNFYWKTPRNSQSYRDDKAAYMREWQRATRAADPDYGRNADLKRHYGVTLEWYRERHEEQQGLCAICHRPETAVIKNRVISLAVDHCHDTGAVRALLCRSCNNAIGALNHDVALLQSAIYYLRTHAPIDPKSDIGDLV